MKDLPPKVEKIVLIRKYDKNKKYTEANLIKFDKLTWEDMEYHMLHDEVNLNEFISKACNHYVELLNKQEASFNLIDYTEMQTQPISIRPMPNWYYHAYGDATKLEQEGK